MSVISGIGLSSGINYDELISSLVELQRQPIYILQDRQSTYNDKISVYNQLSSKVSALKSAADTLRTTSDFYAKTSSVSDSTVLDVSVSSSADVGTYSISVTQLAQAHKITHNTGLSDKDSTTVLASGNTFQFTINGETKTITAASDLTLEDLASQINSQTYTGTVEVEATVVNTGTSSSPSYKLILTSNTTGADYGITIDTDQSILDLTDTQASDSDSDGQYRVELKAAQDAVFTVDTMQVTRSSNTVSDVLTGVTFTLKEDGSSATFTVSNDTETIKGNIEAFVNAYNDVVTHVTSNSVYDTETNTGGPLVGESTSRNVVNNLRNIIISRVTSNPQDMRALSQLGIETDYETGQLTIDTSTLEDKLSTDLDDVATLFTDSSSGIAVRIYDTADDITDSIDGSIAIRIDGLETLVDDVSDDIREMEERLERMEEDLRRQFAALEMLLGGLSSQGAFISSMMNSWANS